jgi:ABC-2 type transport system permease protein
VKSLHIARKTLLEALRDPQLLILFLVFPALLVVLYFFAYGGSAKNLSTTLIILVDNRDKGPLGAELVNALREAKFDDQPMLTVTEVKSMDEARVTLSEWKAGGLLTIPEDFTDILNKADPANPPRLTLLRDPLSDSANFLSVMFEEPLRDFIMSKTGWREPKQVVSYTYVEGTGNLNDFQFGVPGVIIFGIAFGVMYTAILLVREMTGGAFQRLRLARITGYDLLGGITLAQLVICLVQVVITVLTAWICGLQTAGSFLLISLFALVFSLTATGCGMITACFARNDGEAANLSMIFILPLVFFSGAMYPMPPIPLVTLAGRTVYMADLMPSTFAADAIRRVMIFGEGLQTVWPQLLPVIIESVLLFLLGTRLFQYLRLSRYR